MGLLPHGMLISEMNDVGCLGTRIERLPQQFIRESCHGNPPALALAIERADNVVGKSWAV